MSLTGTTKCKFDYDVENDDLFVHYPKARSSGSIEMGDIVLDLDAERHLVAIEIMNASALIKDLTGEPSVGQVRRLLSTLRECRMEVIPKRDLMVVKLSLSGDSKDIMPVLTLPNISGPSQALLCCDGKR